MLLIGCGFTSLTLLHVAEELAAMPYLPIANWGHVGWKPTALAKDERGRPRPVVVANMPGCSRHFGVAAQLAEEHGLLRKDAWPPPPRCSSRPLHCWIWS